MTTFKIFLSLVITFFVYSKYAVADDIEDRVKELEAKIAQMENKGGGNTEGSSGSTKIYGNEFNPSIGVILNGKYNNFLTPKFSFRINPSDMKNYNNSKKTINTNNIFSVNRLGLSDTFETGKSLTLGLDYKKEMLSSRIMSTPVGALLNANKRRVRLPPSLRRS